MKHVMSARGEKRDGEIERERARERERERDKLQSNVAIIDITSAR